VHRRRSREQWAGIIEQFEHSGESAEHFCARRRLKAATLRWWRSRLRAGEGRERAPVGLVAVDVANVDRPAPLMAVRLTVADVSLEFAVGADVTYVAGLVAELRSRC